LNGRSASSGRSTPAPRRRRSLRCISIRPETGILLIAHTDTLAGIAANRVFVAALPESDLPQITAQEVDRTENRVVEMIAVRMPPW